MARTDTLGNFLTDVADAIREKGGTSELIQASDFDTAIENLPSGNPQPKTISELNAIISSAVEEYNNYIDTIPNQYEGYTNNAMTLYTPNEYFKNYWIRYRNGTYQIIWFPSCTYLWDYNNLGLNTNIVAIMRNKYYNVSKATLGFKMDIINYNNLRSYENRSPFSTLPAELSRTYASPSYSTLEECLNAIQSTSTQYTNAVGNEYGCENFSSGFTNMLYVNYSGNANDDDIFLYPKKISTNETIVAIE